MLRDEIREIDTGSKALRRFGLLVGGVFLLAGAWFWHVDSAVFPWLLAPGVLLFTLGVARPTALGRIHIAWMILALMLGLVISTILLALFFYLVITPFGLAARLLGRDFLNLRLHREAPSYWMKRDDLDQPPESYERQF